MAFAKIAEWTATPMGYAENYVVDLRGKLPVPGEQQMQDCTSWALAYGMKSFMESVDQSWSPNAIKRTFSPRFIYNQIRGGDHTIFILITELTSLPSRRQT